MSGVAAGKLRHRVQLQRVLVAAQDPVSGAPIDDWQTFAEVWADVAPLSAREFLAASAEQSEVRGKITIRYREDVDATCRVLHRGKWYAVQGVMEDAESGREHLTLMVAEGVRLDQ